MIPDVVRVEPPGGHRLRLRFSGGAAGEVDVSGWRPRRVPARGFAPFRPAP